MPKAETERCQILRQIDSVLGQQVKVRPPKVEIDSNLSSVFKKNTQILDDSYLEKKNRRKWFKLKWFKLKWIWT